MGFDLPRHTIMQRYVACRPPRSSRCMGVALFYQIRCIVQGGSGGLMPILGGPFVTDLPRLACSIAHASERTHFQKHTYQGFVRAYSYVGDFIFLLIFSPTAFYRPTRPPTTKAIPLIGPGKWVSSSTGLHRASGGDGRASSVSLSSHVCN